MGGDDAPRVVVEGAELIGVRYPDLRFIFHGDEAQLTPLLKKHSKIAAVSEVVHTDKSVSMSDKPSEAVRRGRQTSMWLAIHAVREGRADVVVSAGNTGALMAMSKVQLKMMPGISRPAIAALWPTMRGESVVLDCGANLECDEKQLVDFAILGEAFAHVELGIENPSVGLLNIGAEELKGHDEIRGAAAILREQVPHMDFRGFVEGDDIGFGTVDVVVADGFTGNIALKAAEGTARQFASYLRLALKRTLRARIGALFAADAFAALRLKMDPRSSNGGVFLGLNGLVVKSHGGTDGTGFAAALEVAMDMASGDFKERAQERLKELAESMASRGQDESSDSIQKITG